MGSPRETFQLFLRASHEAGNLERVKADTLGVAGSFRVPEIDRRAKGLQSVFITMLNLLESLSQLACALGNHFFEMLAVVFDLLFEISLMKGTFQAGEHSAFQKRFDEIVVRAGTHGLHSYFHVVHPSGDQECYVRMGAANVGQEFEPRDTGHLEIGNNGIEVLSLQSRKGFFPTSGGSTGERRGGQNDGEELASAPP